MDTENLRTYLSVVRFCNFTRAAEQLFVAQSTVTNRILELKREAGVKLLRRDTRNFSLTEEGKLFAEYARRIVELEDALKSAVRGGERQQRLGATNAVYEGMLKERIFGGIAAGGHFRVTLGHSAELLEQLWSGSLDAVYGYQAVKRAGYSCTPFFEDELVLLVRRDKNAFPRGVTKAELRKLPCAMCNFSLEEIGSYLRELFPAGQVFPFEVDNSNKVKDFLAAGLGYAFLPRGIVKKELEEGLLAEVAPVGFSRMKLKSYRVCRAGEEERFF